MLQFEDSDEDDCESFFLKPTNEYNIVEKIKLANQELFETPHPPENITITNTTQRVTFSQSLVDYEPEYSEEELYCNEMNKSDVNELHQLISPLNADDEESSDCKMDDEINEVLNDDDDDDDDEQCIGNENICENAPTSNGIIETQCIPNDPLPVAKEEQILGISEICAEIVKLNVTEFSSSISIEEQSDSVCDETIIDNPEYVEHTNHISIDIPLDVDSPREDDYMNNKDLNDAKNIESILHDDNSNNSSCINNISNNNKHKNSLRNIISGSVKSPKPSPRKESRKCCSFKRTSSTMNNLPKYSGFYSQYGLSKQQIEKRNSYITKIQQKQTEIERRNYEENLNKSQENEKAFAFWLKNKLKYPKNRTKNMFDVIDNQKNRKKRNSLADSLTPVPIDGI